MEETGAARKSVRDFQQKPKRPSSQLSLDRSPKMTTRIIQHFASKNFSIYVPDFSFIMCLIYVPGKTDVDSRSNRHKQKRCVFCHMNKVRTMTIYQCQTCDGQPGFCFPDCFEKFHIISRKNNQ
ncbi:unnamed protein product [Rotaria sp. Silwood2]|nr:unnamed protein product [Rotaria sp. Silwood2]CAF3450596.1 unnamed protein product [Rotaria sp. Silwood2]